jgi:hypothetical protein
MKVAELVAELSELEQDYEVVITGVDDDYVDPFPYSIHGAIHARYSDTGECIELVW